MRLRKHNGFIAYAKAAYDGLLELVLKIVQSDHARHARAPLLTNVTHRQTYDLAVITWLDSHGVAQLFNPLN
jgi:hypothetical protein